MTANLLLEKIIEKVNKEVDELLEDNEYDGLVEDLNLDTIDDTNYRAMSVIVLKAMDRLLADSKPVNIFLLHLLHSMTFLNIEEDADLSSELVNHNLLSLNKEVLEGIYIDSRPITNEFLESHKVLILSRSQNNFKNYLTNMPNAMILIIMNSIYDNYITEIPLTVDRFIFFPECNDAKITEYQQNKSKLISYLKLCILCEGKAFHKHFTYNNTILEVAPDCNTIIDFTQYNEILYILSEYNNSKHDILNKYFLLYTIIENFMYRKPITQIIRSTDDFSIRDFKRFYSEIDNSESKKLGILFYEIMDIPINGTTFYNEIFDDFIQFKVTDQANALIDFLKKIGVTNANNQITYEMIMNPQNHHVAFKGNTKIGGYFSKIVYQLRNSILHNTATEFHITHYELSKNEIIVKFLEEVMLPNLEKIILHLITTNNNLIAYDDNVLLLYKKDITA